MYDSDSRADRLAAALDEFIRSSPDVEAAAVVSFDGLPMASALPSELEEDRVGAMSAALLSLGEQAAMGLGRGLLNQVFVEGEHGFVFLMSARDQAVLAAIAGRTAKIGFMLFEMRRAADRIGRALEMASPAVVAPEVGAAAAPAATSLPTDLPPRDDQGQPAGDQPAGEPAEHEAHGEDHHDGDHGDHEAHDAGHEAGVGQPAQAEGEQHGGWQPPAPQEGSMFDRYQPPAGPEVEVDDEVHPFQAPSHAD